MTKNYAQSRSPPVANKNNKSQYSETSTSGANKDTTSREFQYKKLVVEGKPEPDDNDDEASTTCSYSEHTTCLRDSLNNMISEAVRTIPTLDEDAEEHAQQPLTPPPTVATLASADFNCYGKEIIVGAPEWQVDYIIPLNDVAVSPKRNSIQEAVKKQAGKRELLLDSAYSSLQKEILSSSALGDDDKSDDEEGDKDFDKDCKSEKQVYEQ
jgi:hypothetical protein